MANLVFSWLSFGDIDIQESLVAGLKSKPYIDGVINNLDGRFLPHCLLEKQKPDLAHVGTQEAKQM